MGARSIQGLIASAFALAVALAIQLVGAVAFAQERGAATFGDPATSRDPFDGGVSDAGPPTDPSLGPDPFEDGGWTPRPLPPAASTDAAAPATASATAAATPTPHIGIEVRPGPAHTSVAPRLREPTDAAEPLVFRSAHGTLRVLLLLQPQLAWEFFNAAGSPNARGDGSLPEGVGANATMGRPDGTTTNRGTFRLRRARIGLELTARSIFGATIEIDPNLADRENPASGTIVRRLELVAGHRTERRRVELAAGVFDVPFGRDLAEPHGARIFVDRTYGTRAMFPEDADMGIRLRRTYLPIGLDVQLAVMNGVTVGEPSFGHAPDLNKTKDVSGRVAMNLSRFEVGLGGYAGQGQAVDAASLRVQQRVRAAIAIDALFRARFARGMRETRLSGEVVVGRNMDRGVLTPFVTTLPLDPNVNLPNFDPRNAWIRLEQDFRGGTTVGVRYDAYTPDASQPDDSRHTLSAAVARALGHNARLMLEYGHAIDQIHAPTLASRTKLVDMVSLMAQLRY